MRKPIISYCTHLLIAWPGLFLLGILLAGVTPDSIERRFFDAPGAAPFFLGDILLAFAIGWLVNRRLRSSSAPWVFIPALLLFLYNFSTEVFRASPNFGWDYFIRNELSNNCMQTSCIGVEAFTIPLYNTVAYALGAWWVRRAGEPAAPAGNEHHRLGQAAAYVGCLLLACGSAWLMAMAYVAFGARQAEPTAYSAIFGPPLFPMSLVVPATLGYLIGRRTSSKAPLWVWPAPLLLAAVEVLFLSGTNRLGGSVSFWQAFTCVHCTGTTLGLAVYIVVPAYGALSFSIGAALCRSSWIPARAIRALRGPARHG
jgi:hypothetical protein